MTLSPYATLLVRPTDSDDTIRAAYHEASKRLHPDRTGGVASEEWYEVKTAYELIETAELRAKWLRQFKTLSGVCADCKGYGVRGTRIGKAKIRSCGACDGYGRVAVQRRFAKRTKAAIQL